MSSNQQWVDFDEIDHFEQTVQGFLAGDVDPDRFMAFRLQHGIYGQRQEGVHMVRIKVPGGQLNADQLAAIGTAVERYSQHEVAHITTRQDIQLHYVPTADTPTVMRLLGQAGLTTREACGNTVRNITACPLAGVCPQEHTDVRTFVQGAAERFLRYPLTQQMPRKFKISFSGCETDCAQSMMHDLGIVAVHRDGRFGFRISAGGGLGHKPRHAVVLEEFVEEPELLPCMEAVIALHNRYSDRKRRAKARIKFLVDKFGAEGFVAKYKEELARTRAAYTGQDYPHDHWQAGQPSETQAFPGAPRQVTAQKQGQGYLFPVSPPIGDVSAQQLQAMADIMREEGITEIRTTQDQKLVLVGVPATALERIRSRLAGLGLNEPHRGDNVVACPGTSTCRLGITSSKVIGLKLSGGEHDLRIRASGCHNGCAQPEMGDIGIYGEGKRLNGKLVPHYQMYFGGDGREGGAIGMKGPSVPSARIEAAVERVQATYTEDRQAGESFFQWSHRRGAEYFGDLLADLKEANEVDLPQLSRDHGQEEQFKVLQLGGGECAGASQGRTSANFAEATHERTYRDAFRLQRKHAETVECAEQMLRLVGQSLLEQAGQGQPDNLLEIAQGVHQGLPAHSRLAQELHGFINALAEHRCEFDDLSFKALGEDMDRWLLEAAYVCQSLDPQLDLVASLPPDLRARAEAIAEPTAIDLSAYGSPLHYIKARNELKRHDEDAEVTFLFAAGEPAEQAEASFRQEGHQVQAVEEQGTSTCITVRRSARCEEASA